MTPLTIELSRGSLVLKAKDETYLAVRTHLVAHEANKMSHYEMQADERDTHERKLLGGIASSVARFKAALHRYTVEDTLSEDKDAFEVTLNVSDRFHAEREADIKRLMEQFIYRTMVAEWWEANYPDLAKGYAEGAQECMASLKLLLSLCYPAVTHERNTLLKMRNDRRAFLVLSTLYVDELMDDIHSEILSVSLARRSDKGVPDIDIQTDEVHGTEQLRRTMDRHARRLNARFEAYLTDRKIEEEKELPEDGVIDEETERIQYALEMPISWKNKLYQNLTDEIQTYIVEKTVADYLLPYDAKLAEVHSQTGDDASDEIKMILTSRMPGMSRRPIQPF
jgi:hypothetical protein